jgi:hypothetical protein
VDHRFSPGSLQVTVDGATTAVSPAPIRLLTLETFLIGATSYLPTSMFRGEIAELVVVPSSISDADVANFRSYAQQTWGGLP